MSENTFLRPSSTMVQWGYGRYNNNIPLNRYLYALYAYRYGRVRFGKSYKAYFSYFVKNSVVVTPVTRINKIKVKSRWSVTGPDRNGKFTWKIREKLKVKNRKSVVNHTSKLGKIYFDVPRISSIKYKKHQKNMWNFFWLAAVSSMP